jgi:hypothetical protein
VILRRKQRDWSALADDPHSPYMFGRLLGANELAVALLSRPDESDNARRIGEVIERMLAWFMEDAGTAPAAAAVTNVLSPGVKR